MFPCSGCGCCCKRVGPIAKIWNAIETEKFPYKWDDSGKCEMLSDDNKCTVYENRPLLCDVDRAVAHLNQDKENFYKLNIDACNSMMDEDGVDESFRIKAV